MLTENLQAGAPAREKVRKRGTVAEQSVIAKKPCNGGGAKGLYYLVFIHGRKLSVLRRY